MAKKLPRHTKNLNSVSLGLVFVLVGVMRVFFSLKVINVFLHYVLVSMVVKLSSSPTKPVTLMFT